MVKCYEDLVYYRFWRRPLSAMNLYVPRNSPLLGSVMWQGRLWLTASLPSSRNPCTTSSQRLLKVSFLFWFVVDSHNYFAVSFFLCMRFKAMDLMENSFILWLMKNEINRGNINLITISLCPVGWGTGWWRDLCPAGLSQTNRGFVQVSAGDPANLFQTIILSLCEYCYYPFHC